MTLVPLHAARPMGRTTTAPSRPAWTLTVEVTISGDGPGPQTHELLAELRRLAEQSVAGRDRGTVCVAADLTGPAGAARTAVYVYPASRAVRQGHRPVRLSRLEFDLLLFLAEHPGRVFTRDELLARVWGRADQFGRTVDVHVRRLRVKLAPVPLVTTVRRIGYRLADDAVVHIARP